MHLLESPIVLAKLALGIWSPPVAILLQEEVLEGGCHSVACYSYATSVECHLAIGIGNGEIVEIALLRSILHKALTQSIQTVGSHLDVLAIGPDDAERCGTAGHIGCEGSLLPLLHTLAHLGNCCHIGDFNDDFTACHKLAGSIYLAVGAAQTTQHNISHILLVLGERVQSEGCHIAGAHYHHVLRLLHILYSRNFLAGELHQSIDDGALVGLHHRNSCGIGDVCNGGITLLHLRSCLVGTVLIGTYSGMLGIAGGTYKVGAHEGKRQSVAQVALVGGLQHLVAQEIGLLTVASLFAARSHPLLEGSVSGLVISEGLTASVKHIMCEVDGGGNLLVVATIDVTAIIEPEDIVHHMHFLTLFIVDIQSHRGVGSVH